MPQFIYGVDAALKDCKADSGDLEIVENDLVE